MLTKDNILLHIQASGSRYSQDFGSSWAELKHAGPGGAVFTTQYYPRAVEAEDGTIVVTSHHGGDDAYMPRCEYRLALSRDDAHLIRSDPLACGGGWQGRMGR